MKGASKWVYVVGLFINGIKMYSLNFIWCSSCHVLQFSHPPPYHRRMRVHSGMPNVSTHRSHVVALGQNIQYSRINRPIKMLRQVSGFLRENMTFHQAELCCLWWRGMQQKGICGKKSFTCPQGLVCEFCNLYNESLLKYWIIYYNADIFLRSKCPTLESLDSIQNWVTKIK